ncbi:MAG TPA: WYL domain-containing protein [Candidatus Gemmiger stercoravium]|uniref:helix-turn-helix transcriptional regulator n=1 Tax=uncultured Subdoligranulum sp. TaxID=512298 RepID=UPI001FA36944|nr:WYL domain-containing protein [uncultured Subdoligranulum sp.]HJC54968.1 WYL domain-containing protein [Candidatus Gemmiger stercoravium]
MPRKEGQKLKLLALLTILARETDENHPLSVPRLVEMLRERGINAERKSVYDDIETLNAIPNAPFEIVQQRGRGGGYYMTECPFELAELKLLVDAVYTSKFITASKSRTLIDKLGRFTSRYRQAELDRTVLVSGRVKSHEERILYSVDALHTAITRGWQVQFTYCDWNLQKQMVPRHGGKRYQVSPWALVWENGYYYLIAYTDGHLRHYRVDKMQQVAPLEDTAREGAEEYAGFNVNTYTQQMFGMFNGPVKKVTLKCENRLAGAMIDRFGTGPTLVPYAGGECFCITVDVQVSPQFYGWVAGFGAGIEIQSPPEVRAEMRKTLDTLETIYR